MSETTNAVATTSKKATEKAIAAVAAASDTLPTVVETAEVALEIPSKVVLNQKLVVLVSLAAGGGLTAGALWGVNKFRAYRAQKKLEVEITEIVDETTNKN